jgi:hypothetical protein
MGRDKRVSAIPDEAHRGRSHFTFGVALIGYDRWTELPRQQDLVRIVNAVPVVI